MTNDQTGAFLEAVRPFRTLASAEIPANARTVARQAVLDWLGCALAGSSEPLCEILRAELLDGSDGSGAATVIGTSERTGARTAALLNGAAGHALDFDDTHLAMGGHPTTPILPAVLALGEEMGASGDAVLTAYVAGVEVACRLGLYVSPVHYASGWHSTGTVGTVGAAAACAHLLGLDEAAWTMALNLAATQASGLKASFGSMGKPFHAGKAAQNGLLAAQLAARGFTSAPDAFDAAQGLIEAAAGGRPNSEALAGAAGRFLIPDMLFKYHASCYLTHATVMAMDGLRGKVDPGQVKAIRLEVHPSLLNVCAIPEPASGLELKFSLRGMAAMAFLGCNTADPEAFTADLCGDPHLVSLRNAAEVSTERGLAQTMTRVVLTTSDGSKYEAFADSGVPSTDLGAQGERLRRKFRSLAEPVIGPTATTSAADLAEGLEGVAEVAALTRLMGVPERVVG